MVLLAMNIIWIVTNYDMVDETYSVGLGTLSIANWWIQKKMPKKIIHLIHAFDICNNFLIFIFKFGKDFWRIDY